MYLRVIGCGEPGGPVESVGTLLRHWRTTRRLSQLALAEAAEISTRHLSCLETGKAKPSREMVLVLASALEVPLRERNTLLMTAGFAPAYRATNLDAPELAQVRRAVDFLLERAEPYGVLVMDRRWDLVKANRPWDLLATAVLGRRLQPGENLLELTLRDDGFKPVIRNWESVARDLLRRLHREAVGEGDEELADMVEALASLPGVPQDWRAELWQRAPGITLDLHLEVMGQSLRLFTTVTTLGTPMDVTLSELRIEHYFPADVETEAVMRAWMAAADPA